MAIIFNEGLPLQEALTWGTFGPGDAPSGWSIGFTSDTTPWAVSDVFSAVSPAICNTGIPVIETFSGWAYSATLTIADGSCTATLTEILWDHIALGGTPTSTLHKWYIFSGSESVLLWGGEILPPAGLPPPGGNFALSNLVLTLGQCPVSPPPPSGPVVLSLSTFTAADGSDLVAAYTPDVGPSWHYSAGWTTFATGSMAVEGGRLQCSLGSATYGGAYLDPGAADCTVAVTFDGDSGTNAAGLMVRLNPANGASYILYPDLTTPGDFDLYQYDGTGFVGPVASGSIAARPTKVLRVVLNSDTITAYADGTELLSYGSATQGLTNTAVGLQTWQFALNAAQFSHLEIIA